MKARMPESIINSARSKLSLNSLRSSPPSQQRRVSDEELASESHGSYELSQNGGGSGAFSYEKYRSVANAESVGRVDTQVPDNLIRIGRDFEISQESQDEVGAIVRW
jgi:hypothetical protein